MPDDTATQATTEFKRADDFSSSYANSVTFEPSAWDLSVIFGQLEQAPGKTAVVNQRLAVTIPWPQAKLALFWLRLQVEAAELQAGKIPIRMDIIPPEMPPLAPEQANDANVMKFRELYRKAREEFVASL
ncbi:MAG: hypothetical protein ACREQX_13585 [Candidatus Binataceae bacterium]